MRHFSLPSHIETQPSPQENRVIGNAFYYYLNRWIQVTNAVDHVKSGTDALQSAKTLQRKSRKCMMIAIILLLVIAIIIVLSILKPWNKGK
ncbi:hypothetical protein CFP56_014625 [Quercus suber]|uniref:t-SNARE coiled-coil homology domain-containing protein n=1 Tax=Quercus suber TaxID=58331 RepID=A0AAW0M2A4_QUESU